MGSAKHLVQSKTSQLVTRLLENPQLPAHIRDLPSSQLKRLLEYIGKEDSQDLLVHATADQISDIIEADTWTSDAPGREEFFSPDRFLEWIVLWSEISTPYLCLRLKELGSSIFSLALDRYILVVDIQEVGVSGPVEVFSQFGVMTKEEMHWDTLLSILSELWDEDAPFVEEVLANCCMRRSLTVDNTHIAANENLAQDVENERDQRRRARGYVTSQNAAAFLDRINTASLDELIAEKDYDPFTAIQIRRQQSAIPKTETEVSASRSQYGHKSTADAVYNAARQTREVEILLEPLLGQKEPDGLLLSDESGANKPQLYLDQKLQELQTTRPDLGVIRTNEIVYLSNVLVEGTTLDGRRIEERESMQIVRQTCNLGLTHCVYEIPWESESEILLEFLVHEPGLIKAFNVGYWLIMAVRHRVHTAVQDALLSEQVQRKLHDAHWLTTQFSTGSATHESRRAEKRLSLGNLNAVLDDLSILCDNNFCQQLKILGADLPRFPNSLDAVSPSIHVDKSWRFISLNEEINAIRNLLSNLDRLMFR